MGSDLEWLVGILRVGKDLKKFHDPFTFSGVVTTDGDTVTIRGARSMDVTNLVGERDNIRKLLPPNIKIVRYERIMDDGEIRTTIIKV
jgi:hypothetical protein